MSYLTIYVPVTNSGCKYVPLYNWSNVQIVLVLAVLVGCTLHYVSCPYNVSLMFTIVSKSVHVCCSICKCCAKLTKCDGEWLVVSNIICSNWPRGLHCRKMTNRSWTLCSNNFVLFIGIINLNHILKKKGSAMMDRQWWRTTRRKTINQGYKEEGRDMYTMLSGLTKHRTV